MMEGVGRLARSCLTGFSPPGDDAKRMISGLVGELDIKEVCKNISRIDGDILEKLGINKDEISKDREEMMEKVFKSIKLLRPFIDLPGLHELRKIVHPLLNIEDLSEEEAKKYLQRHDVMESLKIMSSNETKHQFTGKWYTYFAMCRELCRHVRYGVKV